VAVNAAATGTDIAWYLSESPAVSVLGEAFQTWIRRHDEYV
jgi:hypothetical protein